MTSRSPSASVDTSALAAHFGECLKRCAKVPCGGGDHPRIGLEEAIRRWHDAETLAVLEPVCLVEADPEGVEEALALLDDSTGTIENRPDGRVVISLEAGRGPSAASIVSHRARDKAAGIFLAVEILDHVPEDPASQLACFGLALEMNALLQTASSGLLVAPRCSSSSLVCLGPLVQGINLDAVLADLRLAAREAPLLARVAGSSNLAGHWLTSQVGHLQHEPKTN